MDSTQKTTLEQHLFQKHLSKFTNPEMSREAYAALFTEDAVQQYPYAPAPYATELIGREAIADYITNVVNGATNWQFKNFVFTPTADPDTFFVEFEGGADVIATGKSYHQIYIGRITLQDDKILSYREYWNPIWIMDAFM
ncbi:nuclear transport factor 2 family protein [Sphingobacterium kitahiroshimense]|uniref:nuclear transport factor 2 family protein n=1 Tax=Sphingobacterium kitahiroshimense TaxID=470446 RepID=UPI003208305D